MSGQEKSKNYDIIYWVALTTRYRKPQIESKLLYKLLSRYLIDISRYDCIYGWRCDDTFSRIVTRFSNDFISSEAVNAAVKLGFLQQQFILTSEKAFRQIEFEKAEKVDDFNKYRNRFIKRKNEADAGVDSCMRKYREGKYFSDYLED